MNQLVATRSPQGSLLAAMVVDFELTLNRFGFGRVAPNKIQLGCLRVSWWPIADKHAISFEVNWRSRPPG